MANNARIKVFITSTGKFRAKIKETGQPAYEVSVGGISWNNGKGAIHYNAIIKKCKLLLSYLSKSLNDFSQDIEVLKMLRQEFTPGEMVTLDAGFHNTSTVEVVSQTSSKLYTMVKAGGEPWYVMTNQLTKIIKND